MPYPLSALLALIALILLLAAEQGVVGQGVQATAASLAAAEPPCYCREVCP